MLTILSKDSLCIYINIFFFLSVFYVVVAFRIHCSTLSTTWKTFHIFTYQWFPISANIRIIWVAFKTPTQMCKPHPRPIKWESMRVRPRHEDIWKAPSRVVKVAYHWYRKSFLRKEEDVTEGKASGPSAWDWDLRRQTCVSQHPLLSQSPKENHFG